MKKIVSFVCIVSALYLGLHLAVFAANAEYRNRYNDPEYLAGNKSVAYYSFMG